MTLPKLIPLREAIQISGKSAQTLRAMLQSGKIQGGRIKGAVFLSTATLPKKPEIQKEDLPEYKKYSNLNGVGIWMSAAHRKYKISFSTIQRWTFKNKIIKVLGRDSHKVILNEQDVAYCAEIYNRNKGQGKRPFSKNGTPYLKQEP